MPRSLVALLVIGLLTTLVAGSFASPLVYTTLLVQVSPETVLTQRHEILQSANATIVGEIPQLDILCLSVPVSTAESALGVLKRNPAILYAELDGRAQATLWPDDPGWKSQWGPKRVNAPLAWETTTGDPDMTIAILDSGVTLDHPDLANQLWRNPGEVPVNRIDDDGNGKADDVWGWHFYHAWTGQAYVPAEDNRIKDDYGHGTHVAGIAGAEINNGVGVAGMAGGSRLMTVKVLNENGTGWYFDIARGIVYAVDNGARIINLSLGGSAPSEALQQAVDYAHANGVLVVAASGNDGGNVLYPAACEHVLAVAATEQGDIWPAFSNHGPQVDVAAPGMDIYSTWPWLGGYYSRSGTSMASPHASGLSALVWSAYPDLSPCQVTAVITSTAADVNRDAFPGWDEYLGWGRIDAARALSLTVPHRLYIPWAAQVTRSR